VDVTPGWGDSVQANKAGLLEVADVFVVNKADRPGAAETQRDLELMLMLGGQQSPDSWTPPIVRTTATTDDGTAALMDAIAHHRSYLETDGRLDRRRAQRAEDELRRILATRIEHEVGRIAHGRAWDDLLAQVVAHARDPYDAADDLLRSAGVGAKED